MITAIWFKQIVPHVACHPALCCLAEVETVRGQEAEVCDRRHHGVWHGLQVKCGQELDTEQVTVVSWVPADMVQGGP